MLTAKELNEIALKVPTDAKLRKEKSDEMFAMVKECMISEKDDSLVLSLFYALRYWAPTQDAVRFAEFISVPGMAVRALTNILEIVSSVPIEKNAEEEVPGLLEAVKVSKPFVRKGPLESLEAMIVFEKRFLILALLGDYTEVTEDLAFGARMFIGFNAKAGSSRSAHTLKVLDEWTSGLRTNF